MSEEDRDENKDEGLSRDSTSLDTGDAGDPGDADDADDADDTDDADGVGPGKRNPLVTALVVIGVIAVALFVGKRIADNMIPDVPGVTLTDVHTIQDLRARFNQDQGAPRLVLFVSPT